VFGLMARSNPEDCSKEVSLTRLKKVPDAQKKILAVFFSIFALIFTLIKTCVKLFPNKSISRQCAAHFLRSHTAPVVPVVARPKRYARSRPGRDTGPLAVFVNRNPGFISYPPDHNVIVFTSRFDQCSGQ